MKTVYPEYFKSFKCAAAECPDTCCAGWEIVIDEKSQAKYDDLHSPIGEKIRAAMCRDPDGDIIFKNKSGRCPFLTQKNLCEIYIEAGKDYLCRTCEMFPRFAEEYGSVREIGLGLACPEAAKIITRQSGEFLLMSESDTQPPQPNDIDAEFYFKLLNLRKEIFAVLAHGSQSVKDRLGSLMKFVPQESGGALISDPFSLLDGLEILTDDWRELLNKSSSLRHTEYGNELKNTADYYIYRYLLKSVFDGDYYTKIKLCVFSCAVINLAADALGIVRAAQLYSKEIEYSKENMSTLCKRLKKTSAENIINFL